MLIAFGNCVVSARRVAPPLDIMGMPGFDKLNEEERKVKLETTNYCCKTRSCSKFVAVMLNGQIEHTWQVPVRTEFEFCNV